MRQQNFTSDKVARPIDAEPEYIDPHLIMPKIPGYENYDVLPPHLCFVREDRCISERERLLLEIKDWFLGY